MAIGGSTNAIIHLGTIAGRLGVKDMVRISDARMSGTANRTIVLHVSPDAASGGPFGLLHNSDRITISVRNHTIQRIHPGNAPGVMILTRLP